MPKNYNESVRKYLKSRKWQKKRKEAIELYKTCVLCDGDEDFQVHHRKYSNVGNEDIHTDITLLCEKCHNKIRAKDETKDETRKDKPEVFKLLLSGFRETLEDYEAFAGAGAAEAMSVKITIAEEAASQWDKESAKDSPDIRYLELTVKLVDEIKRSLRIA